jgi:hypothetical protein
MLRELLNASPDLWISDVETGFIPRLTGELAAYGALDAYENFARLAAALARTRAFWHWQRKGVVPEPRRWWALCPRHDWPGVLEGLYRTVWEQEIGEPRRPWEDVVWGDKTPHYVAHVPLLADLFPRARFVHIVRDPRDCASSAEKAWGNSPLRTAQEWTDQVTAGRAAGARLGPARYHELRYEDLLADVQGTLRGIFDFLGVAEPAESGRFLRVPENVGAARGERQVVVANREKWRRDMSPALRRRVEAVCGATMAAVGYAREYPETAPRRVGVLAMRLYRLRDAGRQVAVRRRELGSWWRSVRFLVTRRERV